MKHLRKFELTSEYEDAKGTLANPSVSYVSEGKEVKYDKVTLIPSIDEVWVPLGFEWNVDHTGGSFKDKTITSIPLADTSEITDFREMFMSCQSLTPIPSINTSKGTNFSGMFNNCNKLTSIPLIDTSKGTDFSWMFNNCRSLTIPLIDTSNGTDFSWMFTNCRSLTTIPLIDTSKGTDFEYMFWECRSLTSMPQIDISKGTKFRGMFGGCYELKEIKLPNLHTSIDLSDTKVDKESLLYIINNSMASTDITIMLSEVLYNLYSVDPDVISALSSKPSVTLHRY